MIRLFKVLIVFVALSLSACSDSDDDLYSAEQGIYVLNTASGTWDVSFYQFLTSEVIDGYYKTMNPGENNSAETAVGIARRQDKAYILVKKEDGSGLINVVDFIGFKNVQKISGFSSPASFLLLNDSAAVVANSGTNASLSFCDFSKSIITSSLNLKYKPGKMLLKGKYIYVTHPEANVVSVIDHITKTEVTEIPTLNHPSDLIIDALNDVWIDCPGAGLTKIKHLSWQNQLISEDFPLSNASSDVPCRIGLAPSGAYVYYFDNGLKRHFISNNQLPDNKFIANEEPNLFGGFNIDYNSGNVYYIQKGAASDKLMIYQSNGNLLTELNVGSGSIQTLSAY